MGPVHEIEALVDEELFFAKMRRSLGGRLQRVVSASEALEPAAAEFLRALGIPFHAVRCSPEIAGSMTRTAAASPVMEPRKDAAPDEPKTLA